MIIDTHIVHVLAVAAIALIALAWLGIIVVLGSRFWQRYRFRKAWRL